MGPNCDDKYFDTMIKPHLNDQIKYIGSIASPHMEYIFAEAKAFIFPCNWDEPFGIVMLNSLFAGTPVIAQDNGRNAVNEVINNGHNGFVCKNVDEMVDAVSKLDTLNGPEIKASAMNNFTDVLMVENYLSLYERLIKTGTLWKE
jgi:glycosyltransferase involved in cell wall biosynthesis